MVERYTGKKLSVVLPQEVFEVVKNLADDELRSNSMMVVLLVKEALKARGIEIKNTEKN